MSNLRSFYNNLVPTLEVKKLGINLWLLKKIEDNVKVSPSFTIVSTGLIDIEIFFSHIDYENIFSTLCGAPRLSGQRPLAFLTQGTSTFSLSERCTLLRYDESSFDEDKVDLKDI